MSADAILSLNQTNLKKAQSYKVILISCSILYIASVKTKTLTVFIIFKKIYKHNNSEIVEKK